MPDYSEIYDGVFEANTGYQSHIGSPGYRLCMQNQQRLKSLGDRHLDFGCGAGFVVELMKSHHFRKASVGVDVSPAMIANANSRMNHEVAFRLSGGVAPFPSHSFDIIICFDVLEHLDYEDIISTRKEIERLISPSGTLFCNISLRLAISVDLNGENLHRTVKPPDWWDHMFAFDEFHVTKSDMEMTAWKSFKPS